MQRHQMVALLLVLIMAIAVVGPTGAQEATEEPESTEEAMVSAEETAEPSEETAVETTGEGAETTATYVVQPGDNLFRIALRFGTTTNALAELNGITNPRLIIVGQVLKVPGASTPTATPEAPEATPEPTATEAPQTPTTAYTVRPGDNLYRIALNNNTTVAALVALNQLANANIIYTGQVLQIPAAGSSGTSEEAAETTTTSEEAEGSGEEAAPEVEAPPVANTELGTGITVFVDGGDPAALAQNVNELGAGWVNLRADWSLLEPAQGEVDLSSLQSAVSAFDAAGISILLTVSNAPAWSRSVSGDIIENGPPDNLANFESFMVALTTEFSGVVDAYQIWDEPNLRRNWRCEGDGGRPAMCDTDYLEMLRLAYKAVNAADPNALVITAGLAPTRFNDRINAIDDRIFLQTLVAKDVDQIADAIGAHPGGFANPPDAVCCEPAAGVETHFEDASFYFLENLRTYRGILVDAGLDQMPLWVTRFGWGSSADTDQPSELNIFVSYVSLGEQAIFAPRAFELGRELGYIGAMFLDNLNGCSISTARAELCYTSLIGPDGQQRPIYGAVRDQLNTPAQ